MLDEKLQRLRDTIAGTGSAVIAFSGGVDSTFVAAVAFDVLGDRAVAVTGVSPSVPASEVDEARELARRIGIRHELIDTHEMERDGYVQNSPMRCYHCKTELYGLLERYAREHGYAAVLDGCNADDLGDHRPGRVAAAEHGVRSPLVEAGLTKAEIRALSKARGLPTWDKPAMACLASRIPYGTPVTVAALQQVGSAEAALRALGFRQLRVRHHGDVARIELEHEDMPLLLDPDRRAEVVRRVRAAGFRYVALDLAGFRSGSMNEALALTPVDRPAS